MENEIRTKCTAANERFGATAAGRADLKGSAGMPPLRQAAIPLAASVADSVRWTKASDFETKVQFDSVERNRIEKSTARQCSGQ